MIKTIITFMTFDSPRDPQTAVYESKKVYPGVKKYNSKSLSAEKIVYLID